MGRIRFPPPASLVPTHLNRLTPQRISGLTPFPGSRRVLRSPRSLRRKSMTRTVGFIGLGNMGGPMALNLVKAGFELVLHDINPARVAPLVAAGATVEASAEAVAAKCHLGMSRSSA